MKKINLLLILLLVTCLFSPAESSKMDVCKCVLERNSYKTDTKEDIIIATKSEKWIVRKSALRLLDEMNCKDINIHLKKALDDKNRDVRYMAVEALQVLGW